MSEKDYERGYREGYLDGMRDSANVLKMPVDVHIPLKRGCPVCGIGANGEPIGYVCTRSDCPSSVICNWTT